MKYPKDLQLTDSSVLLTCVDGTVIEIPVRVVKMIQMHRARILQAESGNFNWRSFSLVFNTEVLTIGEEKLPASFLPKLLDFVEGKSFLPATPGCRACGDN